MTLALALALVALAAAGNAGLAVVFGAAPWPAAWRERKPWSCSGCVGFDLGPFSVATAGIALGLDPPGTAREVALWFVAWGAACATGAVAHAFVFPRPIVIPGEDS